MVRKIVAAPQGAPMLVEMTSSYESFRLRRYWFRVDMTLRSMLQDLSDSITYELKSQLISTSIVFDVIANPNDLSPFRTRTIANGIKQCRHYISESRAEAGAS
jgi:hypothetical protein